MKKYYSSKYQAGLYPHARKPCELTFAAGLHALNPPVLHVSVPSSSAVLEPSTARSATTDSPGFLERAALWARHLISTRSGDERIAE